MFLSDESTLDTTGPKLGEVKLKVAKAGALKKMQELLFEGQNINALIICNHEELRTAEQRRLSWITSTHDELERISAGDELVDFIEEIAINALIDSLPIETLTGQFHNELNQRLERLRIIWQVLEKLPGTKEAVPTNRPPGQPFPQPMPLSPQSKSTTPSTNEQTGVSSPDEDLVLKVATPKVKTSGSHSKPIQDHSKILLILCSRNGTAKQAICRFANQMNLNFEIVDFSPEQPHGIVDQIYHHRDAKFAVVYWGEPGGKELPGYAHPERYVGYALGFILGRLGRGRVFVLGSTSSMPLPGFNKVVVTPLDSGGGWNIQLARRMKSGGVNIDLNKLS